MADRRHILRICGLLTLVSSWLLTSCAPRKELPDASGVIECRHVQVSALASGPILEIPVTTGTAVTQGQFVAQLDATGDNLRRDESRAVVNAAQAQLDLVLAGSRVEDIEQARARVREAKATAEAVVADAKRIQSVFEKGSGTQKQMDDAKALADRTEAALAGSEQDLAKLLRGSRQEEIRIAQAKVDVAKARLAQADKAVADCTVTSPLDGTVTKKYHSAGDTVGVGEPLFKISHVADVWLTVYLPEERGAILATGATVRVVAGERAIECRGTVSFIGTQTEYSPVSTQGNERKAKPVRRVRIALPNPDGAINPGTAADCYLDVTDGTE